MPDAPIFDPATLLQQNEIVIPSPEWEERLLPNGLRLCAATNRALPYAAVQLVVRSGARDDGERIGLADFTGDMLSAGAGTRDAVAFARDVDMLGAEMGVDTGRDGIVIGVDLLSRVLPEGMALLADMIARPHFMAEEVARERKGRLSSLKQNRSDPEWLAAVALRRTLYGETPYGYPVEGEERSVRAIRVDDIRAFHRTHITPRNAALIGGGDLDLETLERLAAPLIEGWEGEAPAHPPIEPPPPRRRVVVVDAPSALHSPVRIGRVGIPRSHPDFVALRALNTVVGDYFNSRLNGRLREGMGYTYGAWSYVEGTMGPGMIAIGTSVRDDRVGGTVHAIFEELERLRAEPVDAEELTMVKRYISGRQALGLETPEQVVGMIGALALHELPRDHVATTIARTRRLEREDLLTIAGRYLDPAEMAIVVVGDARMLVRELEEFGEIEVQS